MRFGFANAKTNDVTDDIQSIARFHEKSDRRLTFRRDISDKNARKRAHAQPPDEFPHAVQVVHVPVRTIVNESH
jgi:hypothetical protein